MPAEVLFRYWDAQFNGGKKSIRYETIVKEGYLVPFHYQARVNYLAVIDKLYFRLEENEQWQKMANLVQQEGNKKKASKNHCGKKNSIMDYRCYAGNRNWCRCPFHLLYCHRTGY